METVIVVPFMLFVFLCLLQLMLIAHARVMLDYAAFNAARAGVVHNGNPTVMRNAALVSMLPVFGPVDTPEKAIRTWGEVKAWAAIGDVVDSGTHLVESFLNSVTGKNFNGIFPNVSVVSVDIMNPAPEDFEDHFDDNSPTPDEIDFDLAARLDHPDAEALRKTKLTIRVQWLFWLRVPLAKQTIFYLYMARSFLTAQLQKADWRNWYMINAKNGEAIAKTIDKTDFAAIDPTEWPNGWRASVRDQLMFQGLKRLPDATDEYLMPIYTTHSMPMESNLYKRFVE